MATVSRLFTPASVRVACLSLLLLPVLGCEVRVHKDENRRADNVEVDTPLGDVSVRAAVDAADVEVPIYPGASRLESRDDDHHNSGNVSVDSPFGAARVAAMQLESDDAPGAIVAFYERELSAFGPVTVCRGDIDFDWAGDSRPPRCKERRHGRRVQVAAGTEDDFHMASVTPRGSGARFALVAVRTSR